MYFYWCRLISQGNKKSKLLLDMGILFYNVQEFSVADTKRCHCIESVHLVLFFLNLIFTNNDIVTVHMFEMVYANMNYQEDIRVSSF